MKSCGSILALTHHATRTRRSGPSAIWERAPNSLHTSRLHTCESENSGRRWVALATASVLASDRLYLLATNKCRRAKHVAGWRSNWQPQEVPKGKHWLKARRFKTWRYGAAICVRRGAVANPAQDHKARSHQYLLGDAQPNRNSARVVAQFVPGPSMVGTISGIKGTKTTWK